MTIEILIFCHHFQRRICWVLSSLLQQEKHSLEIIVNISGLEKDNGTPSNRDVAAFFREKGLDVRLTEYETKEQIAKPSLLKNDQIQNSSADWIQCHSADHVFSPGYFHSVEENIKQFPNEIRVMGSGNKTHTHDRATDRMLEGQFEDARTEAGEEDVPVYVVGAFSEALRIQDIDEKVGRGAGGHFFFRREACMVQTGGFYATVEECKDRHLFDVYMNTRSDPGFRSRMGGINKIRLAPLRHLNHERSKTLGYYKEKQN